MYPLQQQPLYLRRFSLSMPEDLYADDFGFNTITWGTRDSDLCDQHLYGTRPVCFKAQCAWHWIGGVHGYWELPSPIDIFGIAPGDNPKLTKLRIKGLEYTENAWWWTAESKIAIVLDGTEVWNYPIQHGKGTWLDNMWDERTGFHIDMTGHTKLNIRIYQKLNIPGTGYVAWHDGYLGLEGTYETSEPPERATVEITIYDQMTDQPVREALVRLVVGNTLVGQGYTDSSGTVSLPNIDVGGYTVTATKNGYARFEQSITVTAPITIENYYMVPIPGTEWWELAKWGLIAVVAIGGVYVTYKVVYPQFKPYAVRAYEYVKPKVEGGVEYIRERI